VRDHGRDTGVRDAQPARSKGNLNRIEHSARTTSRAGALMVRTAVAASRSRPPSSRISAAISTIGLTARLIPTGLRLFRRHPVGSSLALIGILWAVMSTRESRQSTEELSLGDFKIN